MLFNVTGFVSRDFVPSGSPMQEGAFGSPILGFKPIGSTEFADVSYFFHPEFMQVAVQMQPQVMVYDLGAQGKRGLRVNITSLLGYVQVSDVRVVEVS